ncbi:MAG TPA: protease modulator HflC [Candidatus Cloacimonadota bacterium]|nr:protease modulator HflC [Candidatus Cloacimonadota bacterium]
MNKYSLIILIIALIVIFNSFFTLDERQQAIITQFGDPIGDKITKAGLHLKIPFIQKVNYFEKRILEWDGEAKQIPTSDKRYIWLDTFSRWRIVDPLKFYQTVRSESFAHGRLDDIISGTTRDVVSSNSLIELVRNTNRSLVFTEEYQDNYGGGVQEEIIDMGRNNIANQIFQRAASLCEEYGIQLIDVKVKRINYNEEVGQKVYERMISERQKIAAKYRSEGQGSSAEILGKKQKELDQIQSEAYKNAQEIIGRADAEATKIFADAYNRDPNFFEFLKTLEAYTATMDNKNTMIMTTDSDYYKFLKDTDGTK